MPQTEGRGWKAGDLEQAGGTRNCNLYPKKNSSMVVKFICFSWGIHVHIKIHMYIVFSGA
jgi:hypothetical protein